jgi:hypothetical protein
VLATHGAGSIFDWFLHRQCERWFKGCIVTNAQRSELPRGAAPFLPEPLCGNPANDMWFLTLNPGLGKSEAEVEEQLCYCPYLDEGGVHLGGATLDPRAYESHFRTWYEECAYSWVRKDYVTRGALGILIALDGILGEHLPTLTERVFAQHRDCLAQITVLNVVHCKSGNWQSGYVGCRCTEQTEEMIRRWRPRVVVAMGCGVGRWMTRLGWSAKSQPGWTEAGSFDKFPCVTFIAAYHPGKRNWDKPTRFSIKHVRAVADSVRDVCAGKPGETRGKPGTVT